MEDEVKEAGVAVIQILDPTIAMAAAGQTSPSLLRKLSTAAQAASDFSHACKRGLSTLVDNNSSQSFSVLSEDDLTAWREASERVYLVNP